MNIVSCLDALAELQEGVSIVRGSTTIATSKVWTFPPRRDTALSDTPCWINTWSLNGAGVDQVGATFDDFQINGEVAQSYTVQMQLFVDDADLNVAAQIASAFLVAFIADWQADVNLGETCQASRLRGSVPTLVMLEWAGKGFVGINLYLDVDFY